MTFIELLRSHVKTPFITAFAYGSGVFKQRQQQHVNKMIDYLVVVRGEELTRWHESNSKMNPLDYPTLGKLALNHSKLFHEAVYYVPDVSVSGDKRRIKYGVVGWEWLLRDLFTWETMFLAGRLQKPTIRSEIEDEEMRRVLDSAMEYNLDSALRTSLLLNSHCPNFSGDFIQILKGIVSLSYTNDPRMFLAESPQKVENIVRGQLRELEAMYLERYEAMRRDGKGTLNDPLVRMKLISNLPLTLKSELLTKSSSLWQVALNNSPNNRDLYEAIGRIVRRGAWKQVILGTISTPPSKAISYAFAKIQKRFN